MQNLESYLKIVLARQLLRSYVNRDCLDRRLDLVTQKMGCAKKIESSRVLKEDECGKCCCLVSWKRATRKGVARSKNRNTKRKEEWPLKKPDDISKGPCQRRRTRTHRRQQDHSTPMGKGCGEMAKR